MSNVANFLRVIGRYRVVAALAASLSAPATSIAGQVSLSSEIQTALYPRDAEERSATDADLRGWSSLDYDHTLLKNVDFRGDLVVYGSNRRRAVVDGEAMLVWRGSNVEVAGGLLRERWGRFPNSALDTLGAANTVFSLVEPELRLSQPTIRTTAFFNGVSLDVYALAGSRRQPVPESDGRLGFGVPSRDVAPRGGMGDQALAVRVSGTKLNVDWSAHVFGGRSRRPTFVPRFTAAAGLTGVDAIYSEMLQVGGEVETTRADWRFLAEGFSRRGAVDVTGRERTYGYVAGAAEYQRFGAFGGAYNLIPRFEVMADTRGDASDVPFASSLRAGIRVANTQLLPLQVDVGYSYDWSFRGHGVMASVEKALAESPTLSLGFRFSTFSAGAKPSVLDVWKDDVELYSYIRIEMSR
jgi:hypothetical protein